MKKIIRLTVGCAVTAMVFTCLPACEQKQSAPTPEQSKEPATPVDTGLVPDQASTGEPPLIPHEVAQTDSGEECLGCHGTGDEAPKIPEWHATLVDCQQCHVVESEQVSDFKPKY